MDYTFEIWKSLWTVVTLLWPFILLALVLELAPLLRALARRRRIKRSGMDEVDLMNGRDFEIRLEMLFGELGWKVQRTPYQGDWGADLVVTKGSRKAAVQAKRSSRPVGVRAIQEAVASKAHYGCAEAMVVTNNSFTRNARSLARSNGVTLWDRDELARALLESRRDRAA